MIDKSPQNQEINFQFGIQGFDKDAQNLEMNY